MDKNKKITKLEEIPQIDDEINSSSNTADSLVFHTDGEVLWAITNRILSYANSIMVKMHGEKARYDKPSDTALLRAVKLMKYNERQFRGLEKSYLDPENVRPSEIDALPTG